MGGLVIVQRKAEDRMSLFSEFGPALLAWNQEEAATLSKPPSTAFYNSLLVRSSGFCNVVFTSLRVLGRADQLAPSLGTPVTLANSILYTFVPCMLSESIWHSASLQCHFPHPLLA